MNFGAVRMYALNCFWLMVPPLLFNALFWSRLPHVYQTDVFWQAIPGWLWWGETLSRTVVIPLPLLMPLRLVLRRQKIGMILYVVGLAAYMLSWYLQIGWPRSAWSTSRLGFMAPAWTPALWLAGVGLIGQRLYFRSSHISGAYFTLLALFLSIHNAHAWLVYSRAH